jgi:hypothetical protein
MSATAQSFARQFEITSPADLLHANDDALIARDWLPVDAISELTI